MFGVMSVSGNLFHLFSHSDMLSPSFSLSVSCLSACQCVSACLSVCLSVCLPLSFSLSLSLSLSFSVCHSLSLFPPLPLSLSLSFSFFPPPPPPPPPTPFFAFFISPNLCWRCFSHLDFDYQSPFLPLPSSSHVCVLQSY